MLLACFPAAFLVMFKADIVGVCRGHVLVCPRRSGRQSPGLVWRCQASAKSTAGPF